MASKPSKAPPTSTNSKTRPDQISQPLNIPTAQKNSDAKPTKPIPIPKPAHTSVVQHHVTDAARLISSSPTSRKMFFDEVARRVPRRKKLKSQFLNQGEDQQHYL